MPDRDDLERRLWRTMLWDAEVMQPSAERDERDEQEERKGRGGDANDNV